MGEQKCIPELEWLRGNFFAFIAFIRLFPEDDAKMQHEICYA